MKVMLLAAGRGSRLKPITNTTAKPLVHVRGKPLIVHHLTNLSDAGFKDIVINVSYLADQIKNALGDGHQFGVRICYSIEVEPGLETAGGICHALPLLGAEPFMVINSDIFTDYPFQQATLPIGRKAHLILVDNPPHNLQGDFSLDGDCLQYPPQNLPTHTFSGIGLYHPEFFESCPSGAYPLAPLLRQACQNKSVSAEYYDGLWSDVGTIERLNELNIYGKTSD